MFHIYKIAFVFIDSIFFNHFLTCMKYNNISFKIQRLLWWAFIQNIYLILNLHIHFQSEQNQHELSTAAQCWNTATTEKRNIWLPPGINLSYERQFKGKSIRWWHHCFREEHAARSRGWRGESGLHWGRALRMALTSSATAVRANSNWSWKPEWRASDLCSSQQQQKKLYIKSSWGKGSRSLGMFKIHLAKKDSETGARTQ